MKYQPKLSESKVIILIAMTLITTLLFSCTQSTTSSPPTEITKHAKDIDEAIIKFGFDQFLSLYNSEEENIIISPLSIASALYMTTNGAKNQTLDQMTNTLYVNNFKSELNEQYKLLSDNIQEKEGQPKLKSKNQIFHDKDRIDLNEEFINSSNEYFGTNVQNIDFNQSSSVDLINSWVNEATEERIPKVINEIRSDEAMFLINALYFIGDWDNGFPEGATTNRPFTTEGGQEIMVPTMFQDAGYTFVKTDTYSAVELPFKDGKYSMTFVLPENQTLSGFLSSFTTESYTDWILRLHSEMDSSRLMLTLPKMELKQKYSLAKTLKELGMTNAFSQEEADFSNLGSASGNVFLTRVLHDIFIKIDEKGVEGAAATTVGVGVTSLPPQIQLNKPFFFVLKHSSSQVPIFMGAIRNPIEE